MPNHRRLAAAGEAKRARHVAFAIDTGKDDDRRVHGRARPRAACTAIGSISARDAII
jgi:hypothetical protein